MSSLYFSHDAGMYEDIRVIEMRDKYLSEGYGWYWILIEKLRLSESYRLPYKTSIIKMLASNMQSTPERIDEWIIDCIEYGLLSIEEEYLWSNDLLERMKLMKNTVENNKANGRQGGLTKAANLKAKYESIELTKEQPKVISPIIPKTPIEDPTVKGDPNKPASDKQIWLIKKNGYKGSTNNLINSDITKILNDLGHTSTPQNDAQQSMNNMKHDMTGL